MDRSQGSAGAVAGLPDDPLVEILSRVPAKSVCRFRCVCKAWRDLIDDPLNRRKLPQTLEGFFFMVDRISKDGGGGEVEDFNFLNFRARSMPLDIDRRFSFLTKLPEIEWLFYEDSCNGLFLFQHRQKSQSLDTLGYIVCNPATKDWGTVPLCGCCSLSTAQSEEGIFFAFDPAVSSHFHLIQFWKRSWYEEGTLENPLISVHTYSSETGVWSHLDEQGQLEGWRHQCRLTHVVCLQPAFVNDILHLVVSSDFRQAEKMVAVDVRGKTKRMIAMPALAEGRCWYDTAYIGQSQGRLHYINCDFDAHDSNMQSYELSVWVLQDYDTQEWVLKDTVSFLSLFGRMATNDWEIEVVAIHPDCDVVFVLHPFNRLIAYDMDRKEGSVVACFENEGYIKSALYVPCFSESLALTNR